MIQSKFTFLESGHTGLMRQQADHVQKNDAARLCLGVRPNPEGNLDAGLDTPAESSGREVPESSEIPRVGRGGGHQKRQKRMHKRRGRRRGDAADPALRCTGIF